ncbi:MAG: cell wall hydrolase [Proteobacteria bacterium]|nr:cell wall hydrolase [Pseudomonadota bacterium]
MASRWVGLTRQRAPIRRRSGFARGANHALRTLGFVSVLLCAATLNFALYPNALAAVVSVQLGHIAFVPLDPRQNSETAATPIVINPADVHLLAATAWAEARSEGEAGMRAVAHVIVNRLGARFGDNLETVILAPKQFSAWNIGDPNRALAQNPERYATGGADKDTWETAQRVALQVLQGTSVDPTNGALFYHTLAVRPVWDRFAVGPLVIGSHVFFHDVPDPPGVRLAARETHADPHVGAGDGTIQQSPSSPLREHPGNLPAVGPAPTGIAGPAAPAPLGPDASVT